MPLEIETGRFTTIYDNSLKKNRKREPTERLCKFYDIKTCEDEIHFVLSCSKYDEIRSNVFSTILNGIKHMSKQNQLIYIMQNHQNELILYLKDAWSKRQTQG